MSGRSISTTSLKICRDRRVGKTRTPDDDLRDSLTGGSQPNSTPGSPRPNAPAGRHLVARRRRSTPPKNHLPAEGPSLRPSLALDIDPAPVHALTHITPPPASRTGPNPILFQLQPPPTHPHHPHDSTTTPAPHPVKPTLCISSSLRPLPCISSSPANPSSASSTGLGTNSNCDERKSCTSSSLRTFPCTSSGPGLGL